jgi:6-phosphogluconolactonase (cycloisomerase 2 family)
MEIRKSLKSRLLSAVPVVALLTTCIQLGRAAGPSGDVYVMTNQSSGNSVMVFHRDAAGMLTFSATFASGGNGAGTGADPLGSQGALVLSEDQRLLFAVNAGSDSVSVFAVWGDRLKLLDTVPSGGAMPVSLAVQHGLVYVLNAAGTPNISGFFVDPENNRLVALAGSTQDLPGGAAAAPAEVSFTPDGSALVVTEKGTSSIDTFALDKGRPGAGVSFPSSGATPFGFAFGHDDVLIVSDAAGGPAGTAAVSSYAVDEDGNVAIVTPALGDTQKAACWLVVPRNGRFAYTANAASNTISEYGVSADGNLTLLDAAAASTGTGSTPTDMALSGNSHFLYTRDGGKGAVSGFRIGADGALTPIAAAVGVPAGSQGIAAR